MNRDEIKTILPHRDSMLLLDQLDRTRPHLITNENGAQLTENMLRLRFEPARKRAAAKAIANVKVIAINNAVTSSVGTRTAAIAINATNSATIGRARRR